MSTVDFGWMMGVITGVIVGTPFALWILSQRYRPEPRQQIPQPPQHQLPSIVIVHGAPYQGQRQPEQWHEIETAANRQLPKM